MKLAKRYDNGKLTIYLYGELDHHAARGTMKVIADMMSYDLPKQTVLDFSGLTFMDSSGIALLLKTYRLAKAHDGTVWVEHPNRQVLRVLEASGVERFVPIAQETGKE
ncbi:MAG: STAS domain-containing protein [Oscillospiraceae bacterium]|nr:STAS domain-containing protein [Oscillospiraceae bacterium]